jgi:hypothetical protein
MFLKSKWFWLFVVFPVCAVLFFGVVFHRTSQPQAVIKIYKSVKPAPRKKAQPPMDATITNQTRRNTTTEIDTTDTHLTDLPKGVSHNTNTLEDLPTELNQSVMDDTAADRLSTDAKAEINATYHAEKAKQTYQELHNSFDAYLEVLKTIDELLKIKVDVDKDEYAPEIISMRIQAETERDKLKRTVIEKTLSYIFHAQDASPFKPGGEYYDLFQQNDIGFTIE